MVQWSRIVQKNRPQCRWRNMKGRYGTRAETELSLAAVTLPRLSLCA